MFIDCVGEKESNIYRDLTFGYKIYLHQRGQFWPSSDMLRLGQTKGRESLSSVLGKLLFDMKGNIAETDISCSTEY